MNNTVRAKIMCVNSGIYKLMSADNILEKGCQPTERKYF